MLLFTVPPQHKQHDAYSKQRNQCASHKPRCSVCNFYIVTARIYPDPHIASTKANFFCRLSIHIYLKPIIIWICDIQDTWIFHIHTSIESILYKSCTLKRTIKYLLFCFLKFICIVIVYLYKSLSNTSCFRAGRTSYSYPDMLSFLYEADM